MYNLPGCPIEQADRLHRAREALPWPVISVHMQRTLKSFTLTKVAVGAAGFWSCRFDVLCSKEPCIRGLWSVLILSNDVTFPQRRGKPVCSLLTLIAVSSPALLQPFIKYLYDPGGRVFRRRFLDKSWDWNYSKPILRQPPSGCSAKKTNTGTKVTKMERREGMQLEVKERHRPPTYTL